MASVRPNKRPGSPNQEGDHKVAKTQDCGNEEDPVMDEKGLDPVLNLPMDIVNTIVDFLPLADIARCQQLSRAWQDASREWMELYRRPSTQKIRPFWRVPVPRPDLESTELREHAASFHRINSGNARFRHKFAFRDEVQGQFVVKQVWRGNDDIYDSLIVRRPIRSSSAEEHSVPVNALVDKTDFVQELILGPGGTYLAVLPFFIDNVSIIVVVSPAENRILWEHSSAAICHHIKQLKPLALGKDLVYCGLRRQTGQYDFAAFSFRTGELLYTHECRTQHRPPPFTVPPSYCPPQVTPFVKVFNCGGKELVILVTELQKDDATWPQPSSQPVYPVPRDSSLLEILDGESGRPVLPATHPGASAEATRLLQDRLTGQIGIIADMHEDAPVFFDDSTAQGAHTEPLLYRATVARTFTYKDGEASLSDAMVVLQDPLLKQCLALQPFTMTAIGLGRTAGPIGSRHESRPLTRSKLVPTQNLRLLAGSRAVLGALVPDEPVPLGGCFTLGDAAVVSVPGRRSGRRGEVAVPLSSQVEWVDHARLEIRDLDMKSVILDF